MKKYIFIFFTLWVNFLLAQNYQNICSQGVTFFNGSTGVLKAFRLDSIDLPGNSDTIFISFRTIRDTANDEYWGVCSDTTNGSLLGRKVYKTSAGMFYFFNRYGDTVSVLSTAVLNQSWKFCSLPGIGLIKAQVTSIIMDSVADTTDMVKVITLQAKDNSNNNVSHILNGKTIKLSQHFGISKMLDVFFIPGDTSMYYLAGKSNPAIGVHNLTWKEVFDYDTGDVFHYYSELGMPATDIIYIIETVVNKVIKGNYDTIIYTIDVCSRTYSFGEPSNYLNTITQTIVSADSAYSDLQSLPEQFSPLTFWDSYQNRHSGDFGNYNQRMSKRIETGYYERMNSCWAYGIFDSYDSYTYAKGLGCTNYVYNEGDPSNYLINSLVYFKKGSETWGTPVAMDCYDLLDGINKLQKDNFHLFIVPNPVETQARITISGLDKNDPGTFLLYDIAGREIVRMKISSNPFTFDRTGLTSGLYLLSVINQQGVVIARDKIIIK